MNIGLVGVGLLGGSLAEALKIKYKQDISITAISSPSTLEKAKKTEIYSSFHTYDQLFEACSSLDILFLCAPIKIILKNIETLKDLPKRNKTLIITDIGSTKKEIMDAAEECFTERDDIHFIGGHPMAGNEFKGIDAADPYLYENAIYVLTPSPETPDENVHSLVELVKATGAIPLIMDPEKHDQTAAGISHLPQMLATSLVDLISKEDNSALSKLLCAGGFRDMTRIASSQYKMWEDIIATNKTNIFSFIDKFIGQLENVKAAIEKNTLEDIFVNAANTRNSIPKRPKGFLEPSWEAKVRIHDEPGTLLKISTILADAGINIKDFGIQHNREHEGGHLLLGFVNEKDRKQAINLLQFKGYYAREID